MSRFVKKSIYGTEVNEGMGATVRRSIGRLEMPSLDPFLLLDEARIAAPAGFPDHPHRGFETVSYLLTGALQHEDFAGHCGVIRSGDLQWMTAGRGIVHSEMPYGTDESHGLQLWVNLAKKHKMIEPQYQELVDKDIPRKSQDGVTVKVIAGESMGIKSPVYTRTPTMFLDFTLTKGAKFSQPVPAGWNAFAYVLSGSANFGPAAKAMKGPPHHTLVFSPDETSIEFENTEAEACRFLLIAGEPLNEPVAHRGPFVMNTQEELQAAVDDYRHCRNGFERARSWRSGAASR